ncbi:diguanylate cyclase [bacterium]|nr:diguanylate cyclase [bacterium]
MIKTRILLAEDDENLGSLLKEYLNIKGYETELYPDGNKAFKGFIKEHFDLCILDIMMPGKDGFTVAKEIRFINSDIPIIFLTAKSHKEDVLEGFTIGADDYITKPAEPRELASRVYAAGRISTLQNNLFQEGAELSRNNEKLRELSQTDSLTGLGNHRYLKNHLEASLNETAHRGGATCCAIMDIDQLKEINDTHGELVGNEILIGFARLLRNSIRPTDILARISSGEFAIVMHYTDQTKLQHAVFKRIQMSISAEAIHTSAGDITITTSIGICSRSSNDVPMKVDMILRCVNQKLSRAKSKGRDQLVY